MAIKLKNKLKKTAQLVEKNANLDQKRNWFLNLILIDEKESQELNKQYRQKNYPADVLTFPFAYLYHENIDNCEDLGDIFVCYPLVKNHIQEFQTSFDEEICLIFTHGMLHLLGYNHQKEDEKKIMFDLQDKTLAKINWEYS
ncbi:rRNA maturation RNase YbeY [endosymbiont GvMRE of Glomus versiforme]|uniref:rRNA maturation RNase YbeY n=1 Tax=endosymbiont GvMRE of Glomus versiforme TaxID=2039283 RepID=UPI001558D888|nr:rRNA maturation RNase YbeY [endosymbiont GvMRE of Glomus versiforme]